MVPRRRSMTNGPSEERVAASARRTAEPPRESLPQAQTTALDDLGKDELARKKLAAEIREIDHRLEVAREKR